jgi:hypothetical protein
MTHEKRHNQRNPFLMGAGLAFNIGSLLRPMSTEDALAQDAANVADDMRRAFLHLSEKQATVPRSRE